MVLTEERMDIREEAVKFALAELARENVTPSYDPHEPSYITETMLIQDVQTYHGDWQEVERLFTNADVGQATLMATVRG